MSKNIIFYEYDNISTRLLLIVPLNISIFRAGARLSE